MVFERRFACVSNFYTFIHILEPKLSITTQIIIVLILIEALIGLRFLKAYDVKRGKDKKIRK